MVQELVEAKSPKVLAELPNQGKGWTVHHIIFARTGFSDPAKNLAQDHQVILIDLETIDLTLGQTLTKTQTL